MVEVVFNGINLGKITNLDEIDDSLVNRIAGTLTTMQTLSLMVRGNIELGELKMDNWKSKKMFYLFKCPVHGYQVSYPSGFTETLHCIQCLREELELPARVPQVVSQESE